MCTKMNLIKSKLLKLRFMRHLSTLSQLRGHLQFFPLQQLPVIEVYQLCVFAYFKLVWIDLNGSVLLKPGISQARVAVLHRSPCLLFRPDHDVMRSAGRVFVVATWVCCGSDSGSQNVVRVTLVLKYLSLVAAIEDRLGLFLYCFFFLFYSY